MTTAPMILAALVSLRQLRRLLHNTWDDFVQIPRLSFDVAESERGIKVGAILLHDVAIVL
jgi:hypothetical protein